MWGKTKQAKTAAEPAAETSNRLVVAKLRAFWQNNKKLLLIVTALALVVGGSGFYIWNKEFRRVGSDLSQQQRDKVPKDYFAMTPDEMNQRLKIELGMTTNMLKHRSLQSWTFKNFHQAHQAALAFHALGDYKKSLKAYQLAEQKAGDKDLTYQFYWDYSLMAARNNNEDLRKQLVSKAQQKLPAKQNGEAADEQAEAIRNYDKLKALGY